MQEQNISNILFVGNGSYQNRGCEAIVRGTMDILRREFGPTIRARAGVYASAGVIHEQNATESDPAIRSFPIASTGTRMSLKWWASQSNKRLGTSFAPHIWDLIGRNEQYRVALELGGDNYSLDYGRPTNFMKMDRSLQSRGIPVILWGASVGPFEADSEFAPEIFAHLRNLKAIFVRESASLDYLKCRGIYDNVQLVADPAFIMCPHAIDHDRLGFAIPNDAIGINLSPLISRYCVSRSVVHDPNQWHTFSSNLIKSIADKFKRPIVLIPHVESEWLDNDDFRLMDGIYDELRTRLQVPLFKISREHSANQIKYIISQCSVFVGARTHATIAALSSCVPTLSIGYSLKAKGINQDIFGHLDYCLPASELDSNSIIERLETIISDVSEIRRSLEAKIPRIREKALSAGTLLRKLIIQ